MSNDGNSLLSNEDVWLAIIDYSCHMPAVYNLEPTFQECTRTFYRREGRWQRLSSDYREDYLEVVRERRNIRSVCSLFADLLRRIQRNDEHVIIPGCHSTSTWKKMGLLYPFSGLQSCRRLTIRDMMFNQKKCSLAKQSWATIQGLRQFDFDVAPNYKETFEFFATDVTEAAGDLLRRNRSTIQVVHWYTPTVDVLNLLRHTSTSLVNVDVIIRNPYRESSAGPPVTWPDLRYLRIHDNCDRHRTHVLEILSSDSMPKLQSFIWSSINRALGLGLFLQKHQGIRHMVLDGMIDLNLGPSCPHLETLEGTILPLVAFIRAPQPVLRSVILRGSINYDPVSLRQEVVFEVHFFAIAVAFNNELPALTEVRLHGVTMDELRDDRWQSDQIELIEENAKKLLDRGIKLFTSDGKQVTPKESSDVTTPVF